MLQFVWNEPSCSHVDLSSDHEDIGMASSAEKLCRLVDAEPRRAGEHRVCVIVPLKLQQSLSLKRHYLTEFATYQIVALLLIV